MKNGYTSATGTQGHPPRRTSTKAEAEAPTPSRAWRTEPHHRGHAAGMGVQWLRVVHTYEVGRPCAARCRRGLHQRLQSG